MRYHAPIIAAVAAALFIASPAGAQGTPAPQGPPEAGDTVSPDEIAAFGDVKLGLSEAVRLAESRANGKAFDVSFTLEQGRPVYVIALVVGDALWTGTLDANSGEEIGTPKTTPFASADEDDKAEAADLATTQTPLVQAVVAAEQQSGARAIGAGLDQTDDGEPIWVVAVAKNGSVQEVLIDPDTGQAVTDQ